MELPLYSVMVPSLIMDAAWILRPFGAGTGSSASQRLRAGLVPFALPGEIPRASPMLALSTLQSSAPEKGLATKIAGSTATE
jgi:hypothetical protein